MLAGAGTVGPADQPFSTGEMAVLAGGDYIQITANETQGSRTPSLEIFLLGGVPLREPVVQYGPFVMCSNAEIMEAVEDFQAGRFGQIPSDAIQPYRMGS